MPQTQANGLTIEYEVLGSPNDPAVLLIMGLGAQLTRWPIPFCEKLRAHGYQVIRFDNRDVGRSSWLRGPAPELRIIMQSLMAGRPVPVPYTLHDMAADAIGLLDALQVKAAHLVGVSMGGMIGQLMAADYPQRTLSLASIMSSTGNPRLPPPAPAIAAMVTARPPTSLGMEAMLDFAIQGLRALASPGYKFDEAAVRERALVELRRGYNPAGVGRQIAAVTVTGDRRAKLRGIVAPTLVLHGEADPLFPVAAAHDTAACITGAHLKLIPGMGHELPEPLYDPLVEAIVSNIRRAVPSAPC